MRAAEDMKNLLAPLGVYQREGIFQNGELEAAGAALDQVEERLDEIQRESCPLTAESWGLERLAALFLNRPAADNPGDLGEAIAALLRIGGDSFTLEAINDTLKGCGLPARAEEEEVGRVWVSFPGVPGRPADFPALKAIVEDILPAHVDVIYRFWLLTWGELEKKYPSWQSMEDKNLTWKELEESV